MAGLYQNYFDIPQVKVSLTGHSYLSRLKTFTNDYNHLGFQSDLKLRDADINWHGRGGNTFQGFLEFDLHHVLSANPEIVYFELGCNDLDSNISAETIATLALDTAESLLANNVKLVIFGKVLPHTKTYNIDIEFYNFNVLEYNECLRHYLINHDVPRRHPRFQNRNHIWFWDHLRLHKSCMPLLSFVSGWNPFN